MSRDRTPDDGDGRRSAGIDPGEDPAAWERRVEAITAAAEPELSRRSERLAPAFGVQIERWARPVLTAAAALIMAGTAALALSGRPQPADRSPLATASPAVSGETLVSPVVDPWLERDTLTMETVEELVTVSAPVRGLR